MTQIFMKNTLDILKNRVKSYVKIYSKNDTITVRIIDYKTKNEYTFTLFNVYDRINTGYNSTRFASDILKDYKDYVLNQFFY